MSDRPLPDSDDPSRPERPTVRPGGGPWFGVLLVAVGVLLLCAMLALMAATG